eukprot:8125716-Ditylum_brightwellii.AAC.1
MKRGGARKVRVNWSGESKWEEFTDTLRYNCIHKNWKNYTVSSLLSSEQVQWLQYVIKTRNLANNGCTRKE